MAKKKSGKPYGPHDRVLALNTKTGEQYGVSGAAFDKGFAARGYEAVSFEDGRPFDAEEPAAVAEAEAQAGAEAAAAAPEPADAEPVEA